MAAPRRERATLVDVARASNVSRQTVSNVLNNPHRVAPDTRERVRAEIDRLGFHLNQAARSLRHQRAHAIGFQVEPVRSRGFGNLLDPFLAAFTEAAQGVEAHVITFVSEPGAELAAYERLLSTQVVDGFVLAHTRQADPRAPWLHDHGVPFVSFGRPWGHPTLRSWVDVDGRRGVAQAVEHVRARGYRRVAWLGWPPGSPVGDDRRAGWRDATAGEAMDQETLSGVTTQDTVAATAAADLLLDRLSPGDAVVCVSDVVALGVTLALGRRRLVPGVDIGVVGFDDGDLAEAFDITSMRQPLDDLSQRLIRLLEDPTESRDSELVAPVLVERASTTGRPSAHQLTTGAPASPPSGSRR